MLRVLGGGCLVYSFEDRIKNFRSDYCAGYSWLYTLVGFGITHQAFTCCEISARDCGCGLRVE
jgi:hypothetical protein